MPRVTLLPLVCAMVVMAGSGLSARNKDILPLVDFRLPASVAPSVKHFDVPGEPLATRPPRKAISGVGATLTLVSQAQDGTTDENDIGLKTFSGETQIVRLSRFATSRAEGRARMGGAAFWTVDLSGLDAHLASEKRSVEAIELRIALRSAKPARIDGLLSHDLPSAGLAVATPHLADPRANGRDYLDPVGALKPGDPVGPGDGKVFVVLFKDEPATALVKTASLTAAYRAGARRFVLVLQSPEFWGGGQHISVGDGSGVFALLAPRG